ncbi:Auxilin-related protein 1 [Platanthera guangdongensis]|uniref:Auxilin-related protein 1 n=1 Tax=Platanthera guangdongensis TaxID=2320717 RepID=A0ABR2LFT1_9ASPA
MRDLLAQKEQAERNVRAITSCLFDLYNVGLAVLSEHLLPQIWFQRLAESLDAEVKRWSNGKEGNLRALLNHIKPLFSNNLTIFSFSYTCECYQTQVTRKTQPCVSMLASWVAERILQCLYNILGHDSGWQPIPMTEVITAAAARKAYRKATLYVHPDKLQQRGAIIQHKYICEKVFDLLKAYQARAVDRGRPHSCSLMESLPPIFDDASLLATTHCFFLCRHFHPSGALLDPACSS